MANIIQRFIYNLSAVSPLCFVFAFVWYVQEGTIVVPIISAIVGITLIVLFVWSFSYGKRHLAPIQIRTSEVKAYDSWIVAYIISYLLPFANIVISDFNLIICTSLGFLIAIVLSFMNSAIPNPLLSLRKYHFYQVSTDNALSEYVFITKRRLRGTKQVKNVKRMADFLLLDTEGR